MGKRGFRLGVSLYLGVIVLLVLVLVLVSVAFLTLAERKILGAMQLRVGPGTVGFFGILQPFADGLKLLLKETILPRSSNGILFISAPILSFSLSLLPWSVITFNLFHSIADIGLGVLFILVVSSLNVYGIVLAGWSSNSKFAFIGAVRAAAQMISYELSVGLILIIIGVCAGSLNLSDIVLAQKHLFNVVTFFPLFLIFFISILAETNRTPFDLPEAEAELVAGYNVEYSSMIFALFFLAEYSNIIVMSAFAVILFIGGWLPVFGLSFIPGALWFGVKTSFVLFCFVWVRATFPRYRYDQLMYLGWKVFLPITIAFLIFVYAVFAFVL
jgi:NADH-quinone oxidoreductase subunit H